ncbi:MAG: beta galactosidase jelly roll domain-containing protein [Lachnospiraceae bacterium]|nr:beta galactosidase jelly roll domain-containing protein [Lachnospiraceae bacterium]
MRTDVNFNQGWEFILSDTEPSADAAWKPVSLPHDWDVEYELQEDAASGGGGGYAHAGIGWYRRRFALTPQEAAGRHVSLLFEGVYMNASVYLNGELLAHHNYGYTPFMVSLDQALKYRTDADPDAGSTMLHSSEEGTAQNAEVRNALLPEGEESAAINTLLVHVDNSLQPGSRWYSGSGIYRDVHFILYPDVHIAPWGIRCAANAIYPDSDSADLLIQTSVCNESSDRQIIGVLHELFDRDGEKITSSGAGLLLEAGSEGTCRVRPMVDHPHLWDADDPYLYTLVTQVQINGKTVDTVRTPVGIRTAA